MWLIVRSSIKVTTTFLFVATIMGVLSFFTPQDMVNFIRNGFSAIGIVIAVGYFLKSRQWAWNFFHKIPKAKSFFPNVHGRWEGVLRPDKSTGDTKERVVGFRLTQNWKSIDIVSESARENNVKRSFIAIPMVKENDEKLIFTIYEGSQSGSGDYLGSSRISINDAADRLTVKYFSNRQTKSGRPALGDIKLERKSFNPQDSFSWS